MRAELGNTQTSIIIIIIVVLKYYSIVELTGMYERFKEFPVLYKDQSLSHGFIVRNMMGPKRKIRLVFQWHWKPTK